MQKFEPEPGLEFHPLNCAFEGLRDDFSVECFEAFYTGQTGYPMVDASERSSLKVG